MEIKKKFYKRWWFWVIVVIVFFILVGSLAGSEPSPTISSNTPTPNPTESTESKPKTDQQILEEKLASTASSASITKLSYQKLDVEKSDPDRPKDTKMITVNYNVSSFYNKNSFLRETGKITSEAFQALYASNLNPYDAFVTYKGETTDRYGNKSTNAIIVYAIDKDTFEKINWLSFDTSKLCDFLNQEQRVEGGTGNSACNILVNIE